MAVVRQIIKWTVVTSVAVFYCVFILLQLLKAVFKFGPVAVFSKTVRTQPPKCLQDPDLGTHSFVHLQDVRLHYVSAGSEGKPLMLLVHGFPEFWYSWRHQLKDFKDDYRVVAVDQRGYGDSDKPSSVSSYDVDRLIEDLRQFILALGYEKCVLVGHDWGGKVAWTFAQTHPEMVDKFIAMNSPSSIAYQKHARSGLSQLRKSWYFFFFQLPWLPELFLQHLDFSFLASCFMAEPFGVKSGEMTHDDVEAYKYTFGRGGFTAPINYYRQMVRSENFMRPRKSDNSKVSCPALIIWGDQDQALETPLAQLSSQHSVQGGATVRLVEGASHWVQMDRPDLVNRYVREFLSQN